MTSEYKKPDLVIVDDIEPDGPEPGSMADVLSRGMASVAKVMQKAADAVVDLGMKTGRTARGMRRLLHELWAMRKVKKGQNWTPPRKPSLQADIKASALTPEQEQKAARRRRMGLVQCMACPGWFKKKKMKAVSRKDWRGKPVHVGRVCGQCQGSQPKTTAGA